MSTSKDFSLYIKQLDCIELSSLLNKKSREITELEDAYFIGDEMYPYKLRNAYTQRDMIKNTINKKCSSVKFNTYLKNYYQNILKN